MALPNYREPQHRVPTASYQSEGCDLAQPVVRGVCRNYSGREPNSSRMCSQPVCRIVLLITVQAGAGTGRFRH